MASTRNKNTLGDYNMKQREYKNSETYKLYPNSQYGVAYDTKLPGNGLLPGQFAWSQLSNNYSDIESFLFGINSTNLVQETPALVPQFKNLDSVNIFDKSNIFVPDPLIIVKNQRPQPIPN